VHCTKISPEFECQGQRSKVKGQGHQGQKNEKVRHFVQESRPVGRDPRGALHAVYVW